MSRYRRTEHIPGTMEQFRATMHGIGLRVFEWEEWTPSTGEKLWLSEIPPEGTLSTEDKWSVFVVSQAPDGALNITASDMTYEWHAADAWIEAYEQPDGRVRLEFIDGYSRISLGLGCNPIGRAFEEFAELVVKEALGQQPSRRADVHQFDAYSYYKTGLQRFWDLVKQDHPRCPDFLALEQRLTENVKQSGQFGDTETRRANRSQIIHGLNELSLSVLGMSFNELCGLNTSTTGREPSSEVADDG